MPRADIEKCQHGYACPLTSPLAIASKSTIHKQPQMILRACGPRSRVQLALLTLLCAAPATGFIAAARRSVAPECRVAAAPCMVDPAAVNELVATTSSSVVEPVQNMQNMVCEAGAVCSSALAQMELDGGLLGRMSRTFVYVSLGIAGAYVTQGAESIEVDPDEEAIRRRPFDRTLPPPSTKVYDDDDWPGWDEPK